MVFSLTLLAAARQDSRCHHVSTALLGILLVASVGAAANAPDATTIAAPVDVVMVIAVAAACVRVARAGACGGADPIGITAIVLRHGTDSLLWIGAGCGVTAIGAALTGERRPPLFPGLLIAHSLALWGGPA
jgi:hypothetical protein